MMMGEYPPLSDQDIARINLLRQMTLESGMSMTSATVTTTENPET